MFAKFKIIVAMAFTAILTASKPANAQADFDSGNFMLPYCKAALLQQTSYRAGICAGEIKALMWASSDMFRPELRFCFPHGVTLDQAVQVVVHDLEAHPQFLHEDFLVQAAVALHDAWPCR